METHVLVLLGATPKHLAVTSFRMFPNPEVIGYINDGLYAHSESPQMDCAPGDTSLRLRALEQLPGLCMLALMVPFLTRQQRYRIDTKGVVSLALEPLLSRTHWSVGYLVALMRTWTLGGIWYTALYHLAAGRAGAFAGLFILFAISCT